MTRHAASHTHTYTHKTTRQKHTCSIREHRDRLDGAVQDCSTRHQNHDNVHCVGTRLLLQMHLKQSASVQATAANAPETVSFCGAAGSSRAFDSSAMCVRVLGREQLRVNQPFSSCAKVKD